MPWRIYGVLKLRIGINDPMVVETDEEALRKFNETIKFKNSRYQVTWP